MPPGVQHGEPSAAALWEAADLCGLLRPVSAALAGPYGHPFHPLLVTVPIGAWVGSLAFDIASHLVRDPVFLARGAMWLIALGVIGALAAAMVGFLNRFAIPPGTRAFRVGLVHVTALRRGAEAGNRGRYR
ncbi:DUF2231 domain-containing protein [Streptomyces sp. NPDC054933]